MATEDAPDGKDSAGHLSRPGDDIRVRADGPAEIPGQNSEGEDECQRKQQQKRKRLRLSLEKRRPTEHMNPAGCHQRSQAQQRNSMKCWRMRPWSRMNGLQRKQKPHPNPRSERAAQGP